MNTAADAMLQEEAVNETRDAAEAELATLMPKDVSMQAGHYVAVAYQDNWYPGCVETVDKDDKNKARIKFMERCRQPGLFRWPSGRDVQTVLSQFILASVSPTMDRSGRLYSLENAKDLDHIFQLFHSVLFVE